MSRGWPRALKHGLVLLARVELVLFLVGSVALVLLKGSQNPYPAAKSAAREGTPCDFIARDFGTDDFGRTFVEGYMVLILM
jgi:hypothetical protein